MTTYYREINPVGDAEQDIGHDEAGRQMLVFNIDVVCRPTGEFVEEIARILVDGGVGTLATDIFLTSEADIPSGTGPYLSIVDTGGSEPERTHNTISPPAYERRSASITTRAAHDESRGEPNGFKAAREMSRAAYLALAGVRNQEVTA